MHLQYCRTKLHRITKIIWYIFCKDTYSIFDILGTTGFDSKISKNVSIPRSEMTTRKTYFNHLNGEDNYALAA